MDINVLVIGAGPAGLMAAWATLEAWPQAKVVLVDRMPQAGAKLAVTGGGRGNVSRRMDAPSFCKSFGDGGRFVASAFRGLPPERLETFFQSIGIRLVEEEGGGLYPESQSAAKVRDALVAAVRRAGARVEYSCEVAGPLVPPAMPNGGRWQAGEWSAQKVVVAAGGQSMPQLGSAGSGFALARGVGHRVVAPVPGLVGLHTMATWPAQLSGVSLENVSLELQDSGAKSCGGLLFTHHGFSGPAALNLSAAVARRLQSGAHVVVKVGLWPHAPDYAALRKRKGAQSVATGLAGWLPKALARVVAEEGGGFSPETPWARLTAMQEKALTTALTDWPQPIAGTGPFAESMVTAGGVACAEVNPRTMESRLHPGLYFAGEVLDVDGPTGGYNLHWAFASGYLAGHSLARAAKQTGG